MTGGRAGVEEDMAVAVGMVIVTDAPPGDKPGFCQLGRSESASGFSATIPSAHTGRRGALHIMHTLSLLGPLGPMEMIIILAIVVLIFGANRLPELGRGIGAGIKNFKSSLRDVQDADKKSPSA